MADHIPLGRPHPTKRNRVRLSLVLRAAAHEILCAECRVSWRSWAARLVGYSLGLDFNMTGY